MKTNELRIGNFIYHVDNPLPQKVDGVDLYLIQTEYVDEYAMPDKYEPIPLTEEWLLRFGFEKNEFSEGYNKNWLIYFNGLLTDVQRKPIEYVHQLQNLYFTLTGEELT